MNVELLLFNFKRLFALKVHAFRVLVGGLFIFSGFVKAIDPLGTAYKMSDYFAAFDARFEKIMSEGLFENFGHPLIQFMDANALAFSVIMIVLELVLGVALLIGYRKNLTLIILLLTILFFTFLTGYTTVTGEVTDCGCFGDFLKLKPIESFIKDLILLVMILVLIAGKKYIQPILFPRTSFFLVGLTTLASALFCFSNFAWGLPMADFRPYAVGKSVPDQMTVPKEERPEYKYVFFYRNQQTNEIGVFGLGNTPKGADKENWKYVARYDLKVKEGREPKIVNFAVSDQDGADMNDYILATNDYVFMVVAYDLTKANGKAFEEKLNPLATEIDKHANQRIAVLTNTAYTSDNPEDLTVDKFRHEHNTAYPFFSGDATFLKTIIRSNPGLVLLKDGVVLGKWHYRHIPTYEQLQKEFNFQ